jgi:hypothetical protein
MTGLIRNSRHSVGTWATALVALIVMMFIGQSAITLYQINLQKQSAAALHEQHVMLWCQLFSSLVTENPASPEVHGDLARLQKSFGCDA